MNRRLELHNKLCEILECPNSGQECRVYFQPPSTVKMKYPAIVYNLNNIEIKFADDGVYSSARNYLVTIIDSDSDSAIIDKMVTLPMCRFNRHYISDNLNHEVFILTY